ncbi:universal stress protein [Kribbella sp. NPDC020789]
MAVPPASIVVGYDGSPSSRIAVQWATAEASRLRAPLRIVEALNLGGPRSAPEHVEPVKVHRQARRNALDALAAGCGCHGSGSTPT